MVPAPVGTGHLHQLEMFEFAGTGHMRATAQVFKLAFAVKRHVLISRDALDDFSLVVLAQVLEIGHCVVTRQDPACHRFIQCGQRRHLFLDGQQIFWRKRPLVRKIIKETMLNHRPDGDLRVREQFLHCIGKQVSRRVANNLQTIWIFGCNDGQRTVYSHLEAGVDHFAVHFASQSGFGQARAN